MSLITTIPFENPPLGARGSTVKPITEGVPVVSIPSQSKSGSFWSFLDDIGNTIGNTLGQALQVEADQFLSDVRDDNPASTQDSTGDVNDQPSSGPQGPQKEPAFVEKYKSQLMIGGAVAVGALVLFMVTRK